MSNDVLQTKSLWSIRCALYWNFLSQLHVFFFACWLMVSKNILNESRFTLSHSRVYYKPSVVALASFLQNLRAPSTETFIKWTCKIRSSTESIIYSLFQIAFAHNHTKLGRRRNYNPVSLASLQTCNAYFGTLALSALRHQAIEALHYNEWMVSRRAFNVSIATDYTVTTVARSRMVTLLCCKQNMTVIKLLLIILKWSCWAMYQSGDNKGRSFRETVFSKLVC